MNAAAAAAATATTTAAAANIAANIPLTFTSRIFPAHVRYGYDSFNNPTNTMTLKAMQPFYTPTGGRGPILSYLDQPIGDGVQLTPADSNRIVIRNG